MISFKEYINEEKEGLIFGKEYHSLGGTYIGDIDGKAIIVSSKSTENELAWEDAIYYCSKLNSKSFQDWHLPNKEELDLMYIKRKYIEIENDLYYWSNIEHLPNAKMYNFINGSINIGSKNNLYYVRAIRSVKL